MDWLFAFGTGLFAGLVCIGGLGIGLRILLELSTKPESEKDPIEDKKRALWASALLVGQFLLSAGIIYASRWVRVFPIMTGLGLLIAIGIGVVLINAKKPR